MTLKVLFFLLGIVLCHSLPSLGGYQSIDITEAKSSSTIRSLIDSGLQKIVDDGLQKGDFSSSNFALTKINSVSRQVTDGENYKFNCQFDNDEDVTLIATFEVYYKSSTSVSISTSTSTSESTTSTSTSTTTVTTFSYKATKRTAVQSVETSYKVFTSSEIQYSQEIQNVLNYGVKQVIKTSIERGTLSNLTFTLQSVNSVSRQIVGSALFYKCDVNLQAEGDIVVESVFTVYYQPILASTSVVDYSCKVKQQEKEDQFNVTTEIIGPDQNQYTPVPVGDVQNDDTTKSAVEFGCDQVNKIAVKENKISDIVLELEEVLEAYSQVVGNGLFYKFTCKLGDRKTVNITTTFTVHYQITTEEKSLTEYSYDTQYIESNTNETVPIIPTEDDTEVVIEPVEPIEPIEPIGEDDFIGETYPWDNDSGNSEEEYLPGQQEQDLDSGESESLPWGSEENDLGSDEAEIEVEWNTETEIPTPVEEEEEPVPVEEVPVEVPEEETVIVPVEENEPVEEEPVEPVEEVPVVVPEEETVIVEPVEEETVLIDEEEEQEEEESEEEDAIANVVFQFGVNTVLKQGIRDKKIPKDKYTASRIDSFTRSDSSTGSLYRFTCEAANQNKSTLIDMEFAVYYHLNSTRKMLSSYTYTVNLVEVPVSNTSVLPIDGAYSACGDDEIKKDAVIKSVLNYGASQIYIKALIAGKVAISEFNVSSVVSVWKQVTVNGGNYRCEVVLANANQVTISTNFTITYQSTGQQMTMSEYEYTVSGNDDDQNDNTNTSNNTTDTTSASDSETTTSPTTDDGYVELQFSEIQGNAEVQDILTYGTNAVIQKGYEKKKIPLSQYEITKIVSVSRKVDSNGKNYYKCSVELKDIAKVLVTAQFTVSIEISTKTKKLWSWAYQVSNIKTSTVLPDNAYVQVNVSEVQYNSEIKDCLNFGIQEILPNSEQYSVSKINSVYRQVVESALYYKFDVDLSNGNDKTVKLACTVYYKPDIDLKDVKAYSYKINTVNAAPTTPTSNSYTQIDVAAVNSDAKYQSILDYGAKECVQRLTENKVVVSTDFQVSEVLSAYTQSTSTGENCKLKARLTNSVGIYLDVNLNVKYEAETETKTLTSYSVEGSNAGQSDVMIADYSSDNGEKLDVGNCQKVVNEEVDASTEVQGAINYGLDTIVPDIVKNEVIDSDDFEVKEVKNVYREVVNSQNYRVQATLENSKGKKIDCSFAVNYSDVKEVVSYSYITY